ncbi:MAG: hypothetical protein IT301_06370 [Dehalococcoidia bacterium]|nr:hypothetical protein [Dehalococcoidia bacterium]
MTWRLTEWAKTRMPLPGIPWRDMTDEEFAEARSRVPELEERGYFAFIPDPGTGPVERTSQFVPKANRLPKPRRNQR